MTIDEAIKKMEDLSEKQYKLSEISLHEHAKEANYKNSEDSRQIAIWLKELKQHRNICREERVSNCSDCRNGQCKWKPKEEEPMRYNCPHYIGIGLKE